MTVRDMTNKQRDSIVDDLLKKFPVGPCDLLTRDDYQIRYENNPSAGVWRDTPVPNVKHFGYSIDDLFQCYWNMSGCNIREYISDRWPKLGKMAITRRYNRLNDRFLEPIRLFKNTNGRGIWRVRFTSDVNIYVIANTSTSAQKVAHMIVAGTGLKDDYSHANRVNVAIPSLLESYINKSKKGATASIDDMTRRIKKYKEKIEDMKKLAMSLETMGKVQVDLLKNKES